MNEKSPQSLRKTALAYAKSIVNDNDYARLLRYRWGRVLAFAVAVGAVIVGLLGGFDQVEKKTSSVTEFVPHQVNEAIDGGLFSVIVHSAWVSHERSETVAYTSPGSYINTSSANLYVAMTVTVLDDKPSSLYELDETLVWMQGGMKAVPLKPVKVSDVNRDGNSLVSGLQPGLPTLVIAKWTYLAGDIAVQSPIVIGLSGYRRGKDDPSFWVQDGPKGIWSVPVQDRRPAERAVMAKGAAQ